MKKKLQIVVFILLALSLAFQLTLPASAASLDTTADLVIGQTSFHINSFKMTNDIGLWSPSQSAFDRLGNLYVADSENNRIMVFTSPLSTGMQASHVIGQPNFNTSSTNLSSLRTFLHNPTDIAFDVQGNMFVVDMFNNRVLVYDDPLTHDFIPDLVLGQPDFTTLSRGFTLNKMNWPSGLAFDKQGFLFVSDRSSNRILVFRPPFSSGMYADFFIWKRLFILYLPWNPLNVATNLGCLSNPADVLF